MESRSSSNDRRKCGLCDAFVAVDQYRAHVSECGVPKKCALCGREVNNLSAHYADCTGGDTPTNHVYHPPPVTQRYQGYQTLPTNTSIPRQRKTKICIICSTAMDEDDYANHFDSCAIRSSAHSFKPANTKTCAICSRQVNEADYPQHLNACFPQAPVETNERKQCAICSKSVAERDYEEHLRECISGRSSVSASSSTFARAGPVNTPSAYRNQEPVETDGSRPCIICFKPVADSEYKRHVHECLSRSSATSSSATTLTPSKPMMKSTSISCFTCSSPVHPSKAFSFTTPCPSHHIYCLNCLRESMSKHVQSKSAPICRSAVCDYELSRYDVSCLPVDPNVIEALLTLVKSAERAQCPLCQFYLDFKNINDLQTHANACDLGDALPCEHCHSLYNSNRLHAHAQQCRSLLPPQRQQALIDFTLPRTKYPATAAQLRVFIGHRKKNRLPIDPRSLVNALAEFGATFPFDVPTRDCDICMESFVYEDIFVFSCEQNHKSCYGCFEVGCTTKMNNQELLTCVMCPQQLSDGEIKQLRVPAEKKREFLDYQAQKTFRMFTDGTQGVIRCPKEQCTWAAMAENPTERFQVTCNRCKYQFCSLCNGQHHFRTTCAQLPEITQRWFFWCNTERGNYWQARAQQDAAFRAQLEDYERQRAANEQRNTELRQRYDELRADEDRKARSCRLCPHCQRVIEHMGGCDAMVCGQNYHGGDQQSGCGGRFTWSQARPYTPALNAAPDQVRNDMPRPEEQKTIVHTGVNCDSCHNEVQGIRFDCCHCASLIFCEKCEQRATLQHANEIREQGKQQHVFRVIPRPLDGN